MRSNLSAAEQVVYLRDKKDVTFSYMSEEDAERFLADRNNFFKLKAFAKNYDKRFAGGDAKGRYIGLDFAYLVELSRIDKQLRDLVLDLTLDIEHYLKVRINRSALSTTLSCCCRILRVSFAMSNSCQRAYGCAGGDGEFLALSFNAVCQVEGGCCGR